MARPTFAVILVCFTLLFLLRAPAVCAADLNTQNRLSKFGDDLAQAWVDYALDNQKPVRDQHIADLNTQFTKDIGFCNPPANMTMEKSINAYLDNLKKMPMILKFADKMKAERQLYATACGAAFKREFSLATDYKDARTTQKCYELMLDAFVSARDNLRTLTPELRTGSFQSLNNVFAEMFRAASIPDKPDPAEQMDLNTKEARKRFPTTSPDLVTTNKPIYDLLESAARQIEQLAIQHVKK